MGVFSIELFGFNVPDPDRHRGATIVFRSGDGCLSEAVALAKRMGYSTGVRDGRHPVGIALGDQDVRKWSTMTQAEIALLAGVIGADDWETGPVIMTLSRVSDDAAWHQLVAIATRSDAAWSSIPARSPVAAQETADEIGVPVTSRAFLRRSEEAYYALGRGDAEPARRLLCDVLGRVA